MGTKKRFAQLLLIAPLLLFIVFPHCLVSPTDPDYWWHVTAGQYIVDTGAVPDSDPFTFTSSGKPWIAHEWLSEVLFYAVENVFGYVGNAVLFGGLLCVIWWLAYLIARRRGIGEIGAAVCAMTWFLMSRSSMNVRPQVWTVLFLSFTMLVLQDYLLGQRRRLWLLVPAMALWVNLHGGFIIGLATIGVATASAFMMGQPGKRWCAAWPLVRVLLACSLAALFNPAGLEALTYPFSYAGSANASMLYVQEWQSPDFHQTNMLVSALVLALLVVLPGKTSWWDAMMVGGLAVMGLVSSRHLPLLGLAIVGFLAERAVGVVPSLASSIKNWTFLRVLWLFCLIIPLVGFFSLYRRVDAGQPLQTGRQASSCGYPSDAVSYLVESGYAGNLLNQYYWGGYLIYETYPNSGEHVFVDGRADVHGDDLMDDYHEVVAAGQDWAEVLERYSIGTVLVTPDAAIATVLEASDDWVQQYEDNIAVIYVLNEAVVDAG